MNLLVSIITPIYNSEKYLAESVESVLRQTHENFELILINDCSSDSSKKIAEKYKDADARVKLLELKQNSGAGVARNKGIEMAKGRFIAFLDADDFWSEYKLEKQVQTMLETGCALSYTSYYVVEESSELLYHRKVPLKTSYKDILKNCYIFCSTAMYDTEQLGKKYMPKIRKRQDWALWIGILEKIDTSMGLQQPLVYYRQGNDSLSKNKIKLVKENYNVFKNQLGFTHFKSFTYMIQFLFTYFYYKRTSKKKI